MLFSGSAVATAPRGAEPIAEAEPAGTDFLGRLARDWEDAALEAQRLGARVVLLRTGLVLERDGGALQPLLLPFRLGVGGPLGSGEQYWPWIHRDDWVAAIEWLLSNPSISGPVNITAPFPETNRAFSKTLAAVLGRPCVFRVPSSRCASRWARWRTLSSLVNVPFLRSSPPPTSRLYSNASTGRSQLFFAVSND